MMLGVWQSVVFIALVCSVAAVAGRVQRASSLGMMAFWLIAAYGATDITVRDGGTTYSQPEPAVAILAFLCAGAGIVFLGASFTSDDEDDEVTGMVDPAGGLR